MENKTELVEIYVTKEQANTITSKVKGETASLVAKLIEEKKYEYLTQDNDNGSHGSIWEDTYLFYVTDEQCVAILDLIGLLEDMEEDVKEDVNVE